MNNSDGESLSLSESSLQFNGTRSIQDTVRVCLFKRRPELFTGSDDPVFDVPESVYIYSMLALVPARRRWSV